MDKITNTPLFGILLCVVAYSIAIFIRRRSRLVIANPFVVAIVIIIAFLMSMNIPYSHFKVGGDFISVFLSPVTVILAVPLYRQRNMLNHYSKAIVVGIAVGVVSALASVMAMSRLLGLDEIIERSMISKSITAPIGIEICKELGGIEGIAVLSILLSGLIGAISAPAIFKMLGIKNDVSKGIGLGTASHAIGTSKALEISERTGAISSLTIGAAGIATVVAVSIMDMFLWD